MNRNKKYLYAAVGILLALAAMLVPVWKIIKYERQKEKTDTQRNMPKADLIVPNDTTKEESLFYQEGVLYVPADSLAEEKGAALLCSDDVWYLEYQGNLTAMMEAYNIYLKNQEPIHMRGCPVVKQGILYIPAMDLGAIFSVNTQVDEKSSLVVFGAESVLEEKDWERIRSDAKVTVREDADTDWLALWKKETGLSGELLRIFIKENLLYHADETGKLRRCIYTDEGIYKEEPCSDSLPAYENNGFYIDGAAERISVKWNMPLHKKAERKTLYQVRNGSFKACGETPEAYRENGIMQELDGCMRKIAEESMGRLEESVAQSFSNLVQCAEPGDFLVFKAEGADAKYGYFNHSALILEVDYEKEKIHVLHARSAELGVGADEDMDIFGEEDLNESDYWGNYRLAYLAEPKEDISAKRGRIVENAAGMFDGYSFGYGSWLGKKETNCAELIEKVYESEGIKLVSQDGVSSKLKEVLSGNAQNMVIVPDDLLLGGKVTVKAVWKK